MKNLLKEMLIGTILGDAHLGRTGLNRAFLTFEQSAKKSDYLNHIYNIKNKDFSSTPIFIDLKKEGM